MTESIPVTAPTATVLHGDSDGTVVTFYSYKGGVGRSMALANVAWLLASKYGKRVIAVDWDLEAPGLHRFFGIEDDQLGPGLIDYLTSYRDALSHPDNKFSESDVLISPYLRSVDTFPSGGSLHLMSAGAQRDRASYVQKARNFDWKRLYDNWAGAQFIESMRTQFRQAADITLIDSRTGITDIGGVCTVQLPDIVVFVFVFNSQSMNGIKTVASELHDKENKTLQALERWPTLHFLPSRKELSEQQKLRYWEDLARGMFADFCDSPLIKAKYGDRVIDYLRDLSIPYVPYFSYGEELAAKTDLGLEICKALEPLINMLLQGSAQSAAELAVKRAEETRHRLNKLLAMITAGIVLVSMVATGAGIYAFWKGYSVAETLAPIAGYLLSLLQVTTPAKVPLQEHLQVATTILIGALCGAGGTLVYFMSKQAEPAVEPRRFWSYAALQGLVGALMGVVGAATFQTNRFFPLISFFGSLVLSALVEGFVRGSRGEGK